ncbi:MAG: WYL domain-containing protein [Ruminococcaceae bacterium]|nr:WYL domain-containing protein [Oscillospiraceae bacterium]
MAEPKKLAALRILQILHRHSDIDHPLKQEEIIACLQQDYGLTLERKAISRTISELKAADFDIRSCRGGTYLATRTFEDAELKMLIDGVLQSKHVTAAHSKDLIERLCGLSNKYFRSHIKNVYSVNEWSKTENQALFYNIDVVDEAIATGKQVEFRYNKYGIDGKLHERSPHTVSPYQLILRNQRYYLLGRSEWWKTMSAFRMDRISNMKLTDLPAVPITSVPDYENGIDYKRLATSMPYMFTDTPERIEFEADVAVVDQIVDWFGKDVRMTPLAGDENKISVSLVASPMAMKYWAMQYVDYVVVTKPEHLRKEIRESLVQAVKKY